MMNCRGFEFLGIHHRFIQETIHHGSTTHTSNIWSGYRGLYTFDTTLYSSVFYLAVDSKKFIEDNKRRTITTWIVTIITTPFVYAGIIVFILLAMSYYPTHSFNQAEWLENQEKRYQFSDDIINSNMLIGKTKAEVKQILGDEGNPDESDHWTYYLGYKPGFISIDPDVLDIDFKDGKVVEVGQHET